MAIIAALFAYVGRFIGRLLQMALGWASSLLFGRIPQSRQPILNGIVLASLAWLVLLAGVLAPSVGTMLLAAVTVPSFIDPLWIRLAMLAAALALPALIGMAGLYLLDPSDRPRGPSAAMRQIARGYPFAFALAATILFVAGFAVVRRVRSLAKRWSDKHIPVAVKPGGYERVTRDVGAALVDAGLSVRAVPASAALSLPPRLVGAVSGRGVASLVPRELVIFRGPDLEVLIYPSDIAIFGRRETIDRAHAAIVDVLPYTDAYVTRARESQHLEDRLAGAARSGGVETARGAPRAVPTPGGRALRDVDRSLSRLHLAEDDWQALRALRVQVERDILRSTVASGVASTPSGRPRPHGRRLLGRFIAVIGQLTGTLTGSWRVRDGRGTQGSGS